MDGASLPDPDSRLGCQLSTLPEPEIVSQISHTDVVDVSGPDQVRCDDFRVLFVWFYETRSSFIAHSDPEPSTVLLP